MEQITKIMERVNGILTQASLREPVFECNICQDVGWVLVEDGYRPCKCQEAKRYKEILEKCGISDAFLKRNFDNFNPKNKEQTKAKETALEYANNFNEIRKGTNNSISFLKKVGAGKTHLSIAIANKLMEQGIGVIYMPYREVITHIKQNMVDEEYYQREINKYKTAPVLLIDDLFKGRVNDSDINIMYEIINHRYLKGSPMIISCEYGVDKLLDFDEAIGSRIVEMSKGRVIEFEALNYRLFKGA